MRMCVISHNTEYAYVLQVATGNNLMTYSTIPVHALASLHRAHYTLPYTLQGAPKKQSPRKNFVSQQWQHEFQPNCQAVYTSIRATYLANFIKTADMV